MATYKSVMRRLWSIPLLYSRLLHPQTSINKLQVMQNAELRTATGCTQDTNIQNLHDETLTLPIHEHLQLHASQYKQKNTTSITSPTQTHNILQHSKAKKQYFNNGRYTTNIPTDPHTVITTDIKQTCAIYIHLLSLGI